MAINFKVNVNTFLKDPVSTDLGKKILSAGIRLIDEHGLEDFNFKKLSQEIGSTESSVYRYFENKHYLFIYLVNWYWEWTSMRISLATINIDDPKVKIQKVIKTVIESTMANVDVPFIDEEILHRIVAREGSKAYHHKLVDKENQYGFFLAYKALCKKISNVFLEFNPEYKYPKSLASTLIEVCNNNIYFSKHLPRLTDVEFSKDSDVKHEHLFEMLESLIINSLTKKSKNSINHPKVKLS